MWATGGGVVGNRGWGMGSRGEGAWAAGEGAVGSRGGGMGSRGRGSWAAARRVGTSEQARCVHCIARFGMELLPAPQRLHRSGSHSRTARKQGQCLVLQEPVRQRQPGNLAGREIERG